MSNGRCGTEMDNNPCSDQVRSFDSDRPGYLWMAEAARWTRDGASIWFGWYRLQRLHKA
jgi:hypothetical protein